MLNYNPSIFDDKYTVLEQLEAVKEVLNKDAEMESTNKEDIASLDARVKVNEDDLAMAKSDIEYNRQMLDSVESETKVNSGRLTNLENEALKTPVSAPYEEALVGIGTNNAQETVYVGDGLSLVGGILSASGGGGGGSLNWNYEEVTTDSAGDPLGLGSSFTFSYADGYVLFLGVSSGSMDSGNPVYPCVITGNAISSASLAHSSFFAINGNEYYISSLDGTFTILGKTGSEPNISDMYIYNFYLG